MKLGRHIASILIMSLLLCAGAEGRICYTYGSTVDAPVYESADDACSMLREAMTERREVIKMCLLTDIAASDSEPIIDAIFEKALEHTGKPQEGDYLRFQYEKCRASAEPVSTGGQAAVLITYNISYYTTDEQEKATEKKVEEILESLDLDGKTEKEKADAVYDYICSNVSYDYEHLGESDYSLKRTAYAALVDGRAVCQGYCTALYRLLLAAGVDNRIIHGTGYPGGDEGEDHTWNLIDIYGDYYNADVTWDAGGEDRKYYLKSDETFASDHTRSDDYISDSLTADSDCKPEDGNTAFTAMAGTLIRTAVRTLKKSHHI